MKIKNTLFLTLVVFLMNCKSTQTYVNVIKTHNQVMEGFKTQDAIIFNFGLPTEIDSLNEYIEWRYYRNVREVKNSTAVVTGQSAGGAIGGYRGNNAIVYGATTNTNIGEGKSITKIESDYLKFVFKDGQVVRWESKGYDLGQYEIKTKKVINKVNTVSLGCSASLLSYLIFIIATQ